MTPFDPWQHLNATHEQLITWGRDSWGRVLAGEWTPPPQPDLALHHVPDDEPRMSRGAQRNAMRTPLLRIDPDGYGNDGRFHGRPGEVM